MHNATTIQKNLGKLFDLKLIGILVILVFFMTGTAYANEHDKEELSKYLTITPQAANHLIGESVAISGKYVNSQEEYVEEFITIRIFDLDTVDGIVDEVYFKEIYSTNGRFQDSGFKPVKSGDLLVVAESQTKTIGKFPLQIVDFYSTISFFIWIIGVVSFGLLMCVVAKIGSRRLTVPVFRVARFILITIIVFSMLGFFVFSNTEYGTNAVIGIILVEQMTPEKTDEAILLNKAPPLTLDWVLHFGGHPENDPTINPAELNIPIYIIIFGVLGGYLRFFYFTTASWLREEMMNKLPTKPEDIPVVDKKGKIIDYKEIEDKQLRLIAINENAEKGVFHPTLNSVLINRVMGDLSLLLIAPVLAIMMFFVLNQAGLNPIEHFFTFAVTSFIAGLFTENVIQKLKQSQEKGELIPELTPKTPEEQETVLNPLGLPANLPTDSSEDETEGTTRTTQQEINYQNSIIAQAETKLGELEIQPPTVEDLESRYKDEKNAHAKTKEKLDKLMKNTKEGRKLEREEIEKNM